MEQQVWGKCGDRDVMLYTLTNREGETLAVTDFGARVVSFKVQMPSGDMKDIVLGYDRAEAYFDDPPCFGAICGRFANRIAKGVFSLEGQTYSLAINNGPNHLHGGLKGFDKQMWQLVASTENSMTLRYVSVDGEEGYPGELTVDVTYTLESHGFRIDYAATCNQTTILNLTNHSYFNLKGQGNGDVLDHRLVLYADAYTPKDPTDIPTGEIASVEGTVFDFRAPRLIGESIDAPLDTMITSRGYDHNWVLNQPGTFRLVAKLIAPDDSCVLQVKTTEPGVQVYTGNWIEAGLPGKCGAVYGPRCGVALETQHFPDSPNKPNFPSVVLKPGEIYQQTTAYTICTN